MDQQTSDPTLTILLGMVQDIGRKVDDLSKDRVTKSDLSELRGQFDRISDRYATKEQLQALEKDLDMLKSRSLSEMQRMIAYVGGIVGIVGGVVALFHL